ncbi:MAG: putative Cathepsin B [Streblomastix strix]|uniref:Putative Cathepsin B n=1 Tax=Streblomastix strix TaxID=222440 RepID=A0A5J4UPS0_9EUKA|nr:MAG: putative Cathepsin B [Streblomastix strix]
MLVILLVASVLAESIVDKINRLPTSTWVAKEYPSYVITQAKFRARLGTKLHHHATRPYRDNNALPDSFDARERWPERMLPVRDQASCGSCWAFSIAEVVGDRLGIIGCPRGDMAPQDSVSCDQYDDGCDGGDMESAWQWLDEHGLATEECLPYISGDGRVPVCPETCVDGSKIVRTPISGYKLLQPDEIQQYLYDFGPLSLAFEVYFDFMFYSSGIYQHQVGPLEGGHAVLLIGWGVENDVPYWLIQNSWGPDWGEEGHFRILRGSNECECESDVTLAYPKCI